MSNQLTFRTKAPFFFNNKWNWINWTSNEPNKIAAIAAKAQEVGATSYDFGQADHNEVRV